ncbi:MAG: dinitrogenase iron-molybdenum cofactor biosynthesis protein [Chloroflexi bacterium]|nr:MAG: dinitrogenase iron-molybdenum cofactor biosynthesis protein [Chloroflexota bacterium]
MKVVVSSTGPDLSAQVDPRFGRCQYLVYVDTETLQFEAVENTNIAAGGGAGISTAQAVANKGVQAVLTGNCGPNAYQVLASAGIQVITGVTGTVRDAVEGFKAGRFQSTSEPTVGPHFGTGGGMGAGMGLGLGRGMGGGMGRGMGRGMGMGMGRGMIPMAPPPQPMSPTEELQTLKAQAEMMAQQLSEIQRRIEELEKKGE